MSNVTPAPATKPQTVVVYGAIIAGAAFVVSGLTTIFADDPTVVKVLSVVGLIIGGASLVKDQIVKGQVVPVQDVTSYLNSDRTNVAGPAATKAEAGEPVAQPTTLVEPDWDNIEQPGL